VEGKRDRGSEESILGIYTETQWKSGSEGREEGEKGDGSNGTGMEHREEEIWRGLG